MKQYLLDYQSWKTAVVESARLETSGDAVQPLMEATVLDIQKLLPLAELGTSGADGIMGKNTRDAIYKALTAAKPVVAPVGTGGTSGTAGTKGTSGATNLPEITVKPNISTGGTLGTSATVGTSGTSASVGTSGTSAPVGTSGTSAPVGTSGKVTLTSQQKIDAAKAELQKAEDEAKRERQGDRTQNKIERKEKRIENRQAVVDKLKSGLKVADS